MWPHKEEIEWEERQAEKRTLIAGLRKSSRIPEHFDRWRWDELIPWLKDNQKRKRKKGN
jgi:hypothetical protein